MILGRHAAGWWWRRAAASGEKVYGRQVMWSITATSCLRERAARTQRRHRGRHARNLIAHMGTSPTGGQHGLLAYDEAANAFDNPAATALVKAAYAPDTRFRMFVLGENAHTLRVWTGGAIYREPLTLEECRRWQIGKAVCF